MLSMGFPSFHQGSAPADYNLTASEEKGVFLSQEIRSIAT